MASLNKLAIRGIRSFDDKNISVIEFFSPVTVIVGHNGSGKTTIIECLKYATTGDQPPNTRGGAFIHDPKMANEKEVKAQVKLRFHAANGARMLAVRNLSVSVKKAGGLTMKTLESILSVANENGEKSNKRNTISTKCAEMDIEIPQLLGVSKSVLENVIFCHQEESYWPLAEPAALKKKFDDIFEATKYTKALDSIKSLRKDRVADLKAEKERLESLALQKANADKLKARISDLNAVISGKEVEYEERKQEYEALVISNQKFYEYASKFRELYMKIESLQEKKTRYEEELAQARENFQEVVGTDDELKERLNNFGEHVAQQKEKKRREDAKKQDIEEELANARKRHTELVNEHGELTAEAKAQANRIEDREKLIRAISSKHGIKGYESSPLEREKVVEFISRLADVQRRQKTTLEKLQADSRAMEAEYNTKYRRLHGDLEGHKAKRLTLRDSISERQRSIKKTEHDLENLDVTPSQLASLETEITEKSNRLTTIKSEMKDAKYDERLAAFSSKSRTLDDKRDVLNAEFKSLNMQADSRARLELKRTELKSKTGEIQNILETTNAKYRKAVGRNAKVDTMEREIDRVLSEKEREHAELESEASDANKRLQQAETTLSNLKTQLKSKNDEMKLLERKLDVKFDGDTLQGAIVIANREVDDRKSEGTLLLGAGQVYEALLHVGKQKKACTVCNRHMNAQELVVFEKYLKEQIKKSSPEALAKTQEDLDDWEVELKRLQAMIPVEAARNGLMLRDIPALEQQIKDQEAAIPAISTRAEQALENVEEIKKELKDISMLKQQAKDVSRLQKDIERLKKEVESIENDLSATGSTKTADDVQGEVEALSTEIRLNERERSNLSSERERQNNLIRTLEGDIHSLELTKRDLAAKLRDKTTSEERITTMRQEIADFTVQSKELDDKVAEAQGPIDKLDEEHQRIQHGINVQITEAQDVYQNLNMSVDQLNSTNKAVERYVRDARARQLTECAEQIEAQEADIHELNGRIEAIRGVISNIDKEINESGASVANLRENIRVRKLVYDIEKTQTEIDSYDMEEAARARRNFEEKYNVAKQKETDLQATYSHIGGELSSHKSQLKTWEVDLREYKDIYTKYTEQLIRVKMSDMANSDLEKYAKALDNAIMKYHGLKMEEVNDTMRHLWNKTYQGTDIDGIKVRSDVEGGASKRSYNYRVVMTKDQVEMDMRGRCSAGQKMLASIIIRLALSDSFGQNCGILALDEPTNALDTENIDALAASLVDIINERKNHSNFQLIIITHDENFLRKLGQSDVMEYYWRVSRDTRQKSVIERQRFR